MAYRLSSGASEASLVALQAACMYATQDALVGATRNSRASAYMVCAKQYLLPIARSYATQRKRRASLALRNQVSRTQ